jgi:alpha-galactosidase
MKLNALTLSVFLACALGASGQTNTTPPASFQLKPTWFETMLTASQSLPPVPAAKAGKAGKSGKAPAKRPDSRWPFLRASFSAHQDLLEISWEERDHIWDLPLPKDPVQELAARYQRALTVSCNERGVAPVTVKTNISSLKELAAVRKQYLESRKAEYVILTPPPSPTPVIHSPAVFGVRPSHPLLFRLAASGAKPLHYAAQGLPEGCKLDPATGLLTGAIAKAGDYSVQVSVDNARGKTTQTLVLKVGDAIALTPPLGWNSWNCFASDVTAENIRQTGERLITTGLADFGWTYVNIDDCWMRRPATNDPVVQTKPEWAKTFEQAIGRKRIRFNEDQMIGKVRDDQGMILANQDFPDMKGLTDFLHGLGLRAGIYISPGPWTCQCFVGSYGYEEKDAAQFAAWGFDYLKYDWCGYKVVSDGATVADLRAPYDKMKIALKQVNRDIVYSLCQYGRGEVWKWGAEAGGNCWRTTGDIRDSWESITKIGFNQAGLEQYAGPGHWNDPDMLVVGYVGWSKNLRPTYLSPNEQYTHISLWSLLSSPLLIGCDLTRLDDFTRNLLANGEVLAVNQDPLGRQAARLLQDGDVQVWAKDLADGSKAVGIFNLGEQPVTYKLALDKLGLNGKCALRDLWRQKDLGKESRTFTTHVNRHGVTLVKIAPAR